MPQASHEVRVAIVGAGIAGLTAALRLAQRGYKVTIYEERPAIGGNLGARLHQGIYYEVFAHMFLNWYNNFWEIVETDLGLKREEHFAPMTSFKFLGKGAFPSFEQVTKPGLLTPENVLVNLLSGVAPPLDVFLWGYSMIDLLSQPLHRNKLLDLYSVNGFMQSQPTATNRSVALHDAFLQTVWSVPSYLTSAASYKAFVKYGFRSAFEFWVSKGSVYQTVLQPLQKKLQEYGCEIHTNVSVTEVSLEAGKAARITLQATEVSEPGHQIRLVGRRREQQVDYLILAVPPRAFWRLAMRGRQGQRIVDCRPALAEVRRLHAEPVAVLDIYFKQKLSSIPKEYVLLRGSRYNLIFLDLSQVWGQHYPGMHDRTAFTVVATDSDALLSLQRDEDAYDMIKELHNYIPSFNPGERWGDPESDIDWDKSYFKHNSGEELFINEVGSDQWRPEATYPQFPNLFFAGDFCTTVVNMATVEAAVMSGLKAAQALWHTERRGDAIPIIEPDAYPDSTIMALKLLLAPYAYAAKWWSTAYDVGPSLAQGRLPREVGSTTMDMLWAPYAFAADWWATTWSMYSGMFPSQKNR